MRWTRSPSRARLDALPFVCRDEHGRGDLAELRRTRVLECAVGRLCPVCGEALGAGPQHLVGTRSEAERAAFGLPPAHDGCAASLLATARSRTGATLGHAVGAGPWRRLATAECALLRGEGRRDPVRFRPVEAEVVAEVPASAVRVPAPVASAAPARMRLV